MNFEYSFFFLNFLWSAISVFCYPSMTMYLSLENSRARIVLILAKEAILVLAFAGDPSGASYFHRWTWHGCSVPLGFQEEVSQYVLEEWQFARKKREKIHFTRHVAWHQLKNTSITLNPKILSFRVNILCFPVRKRLSFTRSGGRPRGIGRDTGVIWLPELTLSSVWFPNYSCWFSLVVKGERQRWTGDGLKVLNQHLAIAG